MIVHQEKYPDNRMKANNIKKPVYLKSYIYICMKISFVHFVYCRHIFYRKERIRGIHSVSSHEISMYIKQQNKKKKKKKAVLWPFVILKSQRGFRHRGSTLFICLGIFDFFFFSCALFVLISYYSLFCKPKTLLY